MLDLSLAEAFGTIGISLFTFLGIFIIMHVCMAVVGVMGGDISDRPFIEKCKALFNIRQQLGNHIFFPIFIFLFCSGILIELHTQYYTDSTLDNFMLPCVQTWISKSVPKSMKFLMIKNEEDVRWETLVRACKSDTTVSLTLLGYNVYSKDTLPALVLASAQSKSKKDTLISMLCDSFIYGGKTPLSKIDSASQKKLTDIANNIYYDAKNWCMAKETYSKELVNIERRIQFTRSLSYVSLLFCLIITAILLLLVIVLVVFLFLALFFPTAHYRLNKKIYHAKFKLELKHLGYALALYALMYLISARALHYTEFTFNQRVFGYYTSSIQNSTGPYKMDISK